MALLIVPPAFEAAVRVDDFVRFGVPLTSGATNIMDLRMDDSLGRHGRPSTAWRKFHMNALGFRGPEVSAEALRSRAIVVTAGASETFGLYETERREWPRQLEDSLARICPAAPPVVLNTAFAGMSLPTVMQDLELRVFPLKPRVVIYYPQSTVYLFGRTPFPAPRTNRSPPLSPWSLRSFMRLRESVKKIVPEWVVDRNRERQAAEELGNDTRFATLPIERLDSLEANLRDLVGRVRRSGAQLALVIPQERVGDTTIVSELRWLRAMEAVNPKASGAMILTFADSAEVRIRRVAADSGVRLIDPPYPEGAERMGFFADPQHFTDRGAARLAGGAAPVAASMLGCAR